MAKGVFTKLAIACEYLDLAMQLYIEGQNYFCAIHLAAAARWIIRKPFARTGPNAHYSVESTASTSPARDWPRIHQKEISDVVTYAKNAIKHGGEQSVILDPVFEARWHIEHALINFNKLAKIKAWGLQLRKSPSMWKFENYRAEE